MGKNLFRKPFDEGTLAKLKIFENYFKEWLPVFIARKIIIWPDIKIFDLFAGEGMDCNGVQGSPLRILKILNENETLIQKSGVKITFIVNEYEKDKFINLSNHLNNLKRDDLYKTETYNKQFHEVFDEYSQKMSNSANFLFLDQNGIKQITEDVFSKLINLRQTDFLFFISSSYIKRFAELEEFKKYLKITKQELEGKSYYHIHRIVLDYYRTKIPQAKNYYLAPFSIMKPSGIYGLIFGTNHTLGIEKFLSVCWNFDTLTGEANFDIDNERININQPSLFQELNIPTKRQIFENALKHQILTEKIKEIKSAYLFALNECFLLKDVNRVLKKLKAEKKIFFDFNLISTRVHKIIGTSDIKIL